MKKQRLLHTQMKMRTKYLCDYRPSDGRFFRHRGSFNPIRFFSSNWLNLNWAVLYWKRLFLVIMQTSV